MLLQATVVVTLFGKESLVELDLSEIVAEMKWCKHVVSPDNHWMASFANFIRFSLSCQWLFLPLLYKVHFNYISVSSLYYIRIWSSNMHSFKYEKLETCWLQVTSVLAFQVKSLNKICLWLILNSKISLWCACIIHRSTIFLKVE